MKIVQINSHVCQGGAARIALYIHRQLLRDGEESYIAYGRGNGADHCVRIDRQPEILLSAFLTRVTGLCGWWNRAATKRLLRYLDQIQPDVIHLHTLHGYYLNFGMLFDYINERKIPCVWTFHDCHAFTGNCGYFFECDRWRTGCGNCPNRRGYPKSLFFDFTEYMWKRKKAWFTGDAPKVIVTPSEWLTSKAKESYFEKYPCVTIHNGIDAVNTFYPRNRLKVREKYGFRPDEKIVLGIAIGYSDPRKGARYILQAARDLSQEARFVLIGWEHANDAMLEGLTNVVALPVIQDTDTLAEYYSLADVFVLPSLAENYATVTLESMACGTPVVGFDAGGIPEQLTGGKGITVPAGDQAAFTAAICKVLSPDNGLLRGRPLAECIRRDNSIEGMVAKYREIYETISMHVHL